MDNATDSRSSGPGLGSRDSRRVGRPISSTSAMIGTFTRKTEPHQKCCNNAPPNNGPAAAPAAPMALHTPIAKDRSLASVNVDRISASVDGIRVAPATPSNARHRISHPAVGAYAAPTLSNANSVPPTSRRRLRP